MSKIFRIPIHELTTMMIATWAVDFVLYNNMLLNLKTSPEWLLGNRLHIFSRGQVTNFHICTNASLFAFWLLHLPISYHTLAYSCKKTGETFIVLLFFSDFTCQNFSINLCSTRFQTPAGSFLIFSKFLLHLLLMASRRVPLFWLWQSTLLHLQK